MLSPVDIPASPSRKVILPRWPVLVIVRELIERVRRTRFRRLVGPVRAAVITSPAEPVVDGGWIERPAPVQAAEKVLPLRRAGGKNLDALLLVQLSPRRLGLFRWERKQ
jgi:hypothetical protein